MVHNAITLLIYRAVESYGEVEQERKAGVDVVLVSAGDIKMIKNAYPNYFLDIRQFADRLSAIIEAVKT